MALTPVTDLRQSHSSATVTKVTHHAAPDSRAFMPRVSVRPEAA